MGEQFVYDFSQGDASMKNLLGGKGANLAQMVRLDLPVPPTMAEHRKEISACAASGVTPTPFTKIIYPRSPLRYGKDTACGLLLPRSTEKTPEAAKPPGVQ